LRSTLAHLPGLGFYKTLIDDGKVQCEPMITGVVGLHEVDGAFAALGDPEQHAKILVDPTKGV
jgi:threonine dehydrogenase-like Zn-dependent dehydrogenase